MEKLKYYHKDASLHCVRSLPVGRQVHDKRRFNKVAPCHSERSDESLEWLMLDVISQTFTHFLRMYPTKF